MAHMTVECREELWCWRAGKAGRGSGRGGSRCGFGLEANVRTARLQVVLSKDTRKVFPMKGSVPNGTETQNARNQVAAVLIIICNSNPTCLGRANSVTQV